MAAAVLYPAARKASAPESAAAITRPGVEGPPAIGATTTGRRASPASGSAMNPDCPETGRAHTAPAGVRAERSLTRGRDARHHSGRHRAPRDHGVRRDAADHGDS